MSRIVVVWYGFVVRSIIVGGKERRKLDQRFVREWAKRRTYDRPNGPPRRTIFEFDMYMDRVSSVDVCRSVNTIHSIG